MTTTQHVFTNDQKRAEAEREAMMRRKLYPRWITQGRMTQEQADRAIRIMEAIAKDYSGPDLFDVKRFD